MAQGWNQRTAAVRRKNAFTPGSHVRNEQVLMSSGQTKRLCIETHRTRVLGIIRNVA